MYLSKSSTFTFPSGIRNRKGSNPYEADRFCCWSTLVTNSYDFPRPLLFSCTFTSRFCLLFVSCVKVHFLLLSSIHLSTHSSGFRSTRHHNKLATTEGQIATGGDLTQTLFVASRMKLILNNSLV